MPRLHPPLTACPFADQITWVVSGLPIGLAAGYLLSTVLTPIVGYRRLVQMAAPVSIISWIMLALSFEFPLLLTARVRHAIEEDRRHPMPLKA